MPISEKQYPVRFTAKGLVDAFDATDKFPGACIQLANLIFDQSNPEIVVSRPGVVTVADFTSGSNYLNCPGGAADDASTPDSVPLAILGDIDLRALIDPYSWTPTTFMQIIGKQNATGNQISYGMRLNQTTGVLAFVWSVAGSVAISVTSTVAVPGVVGTPLWIRATLQVDNGAGGKTVTFYTSTDGVTWTMLGAAVTSAGTTSIFASTTPLLIGARSDPATPLPFTGKIYQAQVYNGINGTLVASFRGSDAAVGATTVVSSATGETYTCAGAASIQGTVFQSPGIVSVQATIGARTYGMIGTARNSGKDEPFCFNNATGSFEAVSGVTNALSPNTPASAGAWAPPTMAMVGVNLIVTHPGFTGTANKFGWFDLTSPGAPIWNAGDTATNALPSVPTAVANFNNRAYFSCSNTTPYTDILSLTRTAGSQALTIGDGSDITAFSGLPVQTTSSGVVQALIVFKAFQVWQVTGDPATVGGSNLALNYLSLTVGCASPRSCVQAPPGLYFASIAGPRIIDQFGILKEVVHGPQDADPDIQMPFQNAVVPSRIAAGYSGNIYRVCMETLVRGVDSVNDYWFDEGRRRWCGPHTFSFDCASQYANYFILNSNAAPAKLFKSESLPSINSSYTDAGTAFMCTMKSSTFPKTGHMVMKQVVESTQELASAGSVTSYAITALDELDNTLNSCNVSITPTGTLWGSGVWGGFNWGSSLNIPTVYNVPWTAPLVFKKMALYIAATAQTALSLGTFYARYKEAGYTNNK